MRIPSQELKWLKLASKSSQHFSELKARRLAQEPLQYILGSQPFGPLDLLVRPPVHIPRPETENWSIRLSNLIRNTSSPLRLLDLGTGSGCIPLLLCHLLPPGTLYSIGVDISSHAIELARENAINCRIHTHPSSINDNQNVFSPIQADYTSPTFLQNPNLSPPFHVITANPPYIPSAVFNSLDLSVTQYEDRNAFVAGPDGLDFYRHIARLLSNDGFLHPGAIIALEIGHDQGQSVQSIFETIPRFHSSSIWLDPWQKDRVVLIKTLPGDK